MWIKRSHWLGAPNPYLGVASPSITREADPQEGSASPLEQNVHLEERKSFLFCLQEFLAWRGDRWEAVLPQRSLGDIV